MSEPLRGPAVRVASYKMSPALCFSLHSVASSLTTGCHSRWVQVGEGCQGRSYPAPDRVEVLGASAQRDPVLMSPLPYPIEGAKQFQWRGWSRDSRVPQMIVSQGKYAGRSWSLAGHLVPSAG